MYYLVTAQVLSHEKCETSIWLGRTMFISGVRITRDCSCDLISKFDYKIEFYGDPYTISPTSFSHFDVSNHYLTNMATF